MPSICHRQREGFLDHNKPVVTHFAPARFIAATRKLSSIWWLTLYDDTGPKRKNSPTGFWRRGLFNNIDKLLGLCTNNPRPSDDIHSINAPLA